MAQCTSYNVCVSKNSITIRLGSGVDVRRNCFRKHSNRTSPQYFGNDVSISLLLLLLLLLVVLLFVSLWRVAVLVFGHGTRLLGGRS